MLVKKLALAPPFPAVGRPQSIPLPTLPCLLAAKGLGDLDDDDDDESDGWEDDDIDLDDVCAWYRYM